MVRNQWHPHITPAAEELAHKVDKLKAWHRPTTLDLTEAIDAGEKQRRETVLYLATASIINNLFLKTQAPGFDRIRAGACSAWC